MLFGMHTQAHCQSHLRNIWFPALCETVSSPLILWEHGFRTYCPPCSLGEVKGACYDLHCCKPPKSASPVPLTISTGCLNVTKPRRGVQCASGSGRFRQHASYGKASCVLLSWWCKRPQGFLSCQQRDGGSHVTYQRIQEHICTDPLTTSGGDADVIWGM